MCIIIVKEEKLVSQDDKDSSSIYYKVFDYMVIFVPELNPKIFAIIILNFPCGILLPLPFKPSCELHNNSSVIIVFENGSGLTIFNNDQRAIAVI